MKRYLDQVRELACRTAAPVIYAGDIFDKWNSPPELINFALEQLPPGYAIPGQHDLPCHAYEDVHKSAYYTLCHSGHLIDLKPNEPVEIVKNKVRLHGFPWGHTPYPCKNKKQDWIDVAVVHDYCWIKNKGYQGAPEDKAMSKHLVRLMGYDLAVFGDNHIQFLVEGK